MGIKKQNRNGRWALGTMALILLVASTAGAKQYPSNTVQMCHLGSQPGQIKFLTSKLCGATGLCILEEKVHILLHADSAPLFTIHRTSNLEPNPTLAPVHYACQEAMLTVHPANGMPVNLYLKPSQDGLVIDPLLTSNLQFGLDELDLPDGPRGKSSIEDLEQTLYLLQDLNPNPFLKARVLRIRESLAKRQTEVARSLLSNTPSERMTPALREEMEELEISFKRLEDSTRPVTVITSTLLAEVTGCKAALPPAPNPTMYWSGTHLCYRKSSCQEPHTCLQTGPNQRKAQQNAHAADSSTIVKKVGGGRACMYREYYQIVGLPGPGLGGDDAKPVRVDHEQDREQQGDGNGCRLEGFPVDSVIAVLDGPKVLFKSPAMELRLEDMNGQRTLDSKELNSLIGSSAGSPVLGQGTLLLDNSTGRLHSVSNQDQSWSFWHPPSTGETMPVPIQYLAAPDQKSVAALVPMRKSESNHTYQLWVIHVTTQAK